MLNRLENSLRVLDPLSVKNMACNGSVAGSLESGGIVLKWSGEGEAPYVLFDFGQKVAGLLRIHSRRLVGPCLGVRYFYGPFEDFTPFELTASFGEWQSKELAAFRFLKITLAREFPCPAEVQLDCVKLVRTDYPLVRTGSFSCDDTELNDIWAAGINTVQLCVEPNSLAGYSEHYHPENRQWLKEWTSIHSAVPYTIWDGVRRDREAWLADAMMGAFGFLYAGGDTAPILNNFEIWSEFQQPDGELTVSSFSRQKYIEYQFWFATALHNYLEFTGDIKTASRFYQTFQLAQNWIMGRIDERNLLSVDKSEPRGLTWQWTIRGDGIVTYLQAVLYKNLLSASSIEKLFGNEQKSIYYSEKAEAVKEAINKYLWNDAKGCYETSIEGKNHFDAIAQDGNATCLLFGIAEGDRIERTQKFLKEKCWTPFGSATYDRKIPADQDVFLNSNWPHNRQIWVYGVMLEIEALLKHGFRDDAIELTKRTFSNMLRRGTGTLWEMCLAENGDTPRVPFCTDTYNSFCHAWGAYISYLMQAYIAGIRPLENGFAKVLIAPMPCGLKKINACVPTPKGKIFISYNIVKGKAVINIDLPKTVSYEFDASSLEVTDIDLFINGKEEPSQQHIK